MRTRAFSRILWLIVLGGALFLSAHMVWAGATALGIAMLASTAFAAERRLPDP